MDFIFQFFFCIVLQASLFLYAFIAYTLFNYLQVAEELYQAGFISYPRTETDNFSSRTDLHVGNCCLLFQAWIIITIVGCSHFRWILKACCLTWILWHYIILMVCCI